MIEVIERFAVSATKMQPSLLGRTTGSTETWATIAYEQFVSQLDDFQEIVKEVLEYGLKLHLTLKGLEYETLEVQFAPPPSLNPEKEEQAKKIRTDRVIAELQNKLITPEEARKQLGYNPQEIDEKLSLDNPDADSQKFPDEDYKKAYEYQLNLITAFYKEGIQKALKEVLGFYKNFITFDDFANYIFYKLEEHTELTPEIKEKLLKNLEKIYKKAKKKVVTIETGLGIPDTRTMRFIDQMNDIYLGKFFKADQKTRLEVLKWMKNYYLNEGNPIGKGQTGVEEFLDKFGDYLKVKTENKARQIIDTTINFVRNAAAINGYKEVNIKEFVWDAVNDRLTCPACRSMDGRVIKTEYAVQQLEEVISKGLQAKPIITMPYKGKTDKAPGKFPPLHPSCRCSTYANIKDKEITFFVERPANKTLTPAQTHLESEFKNLTNDEIYYRVKAHQGASWYRLPKDWKKKDVENFLGRKLLDHFNNHGREVGAKTVEEYKKMAYEIIKNPDEIYVERIISYPKGKPKEDTTFIFFKGDKKVVSSDDALAIKSFYVEPLDKYIQRTEDKLRKLFRGNTDWGLIKIK